MPKQVGTCITYLVKLGYAIVKASSNGTKNLIHTWGTNMQSLIHETSLELVDMLNLKGEHKSVGSFGDVITPEGKVITRDQLLEMAYEYVLSNLEG